jgi:hypothetical protein
MDNAYVREPEDVLGQFKVSENRGLSEKDIASLQGKHGKNGTYRLSDLCVTCIADRVDSDT